MHTVYVMQAKKILKGDADATVWDNKHCKMCGQKIKELAKKAKQENERQLSDTINNTRSTNLFTPCVIYRHVHSLRQPAPI